MQISPSPLRQLSAPLKSNRPNRGSCDLLGTSEISTWCDRAESQCFDQKLLHGSDFTVFPVDLNNGIFSELPRRVDCGNASDTETGKPLAADAPSAASSTDHVALGSKRFDGDDVAQLKEHEDSRGYSRLQCPIPEPETGRNWRPESPLAGGCSQYVALPPDSGIGVDGGSDVRTSSRTDSPISRNQENGDDFPLLPKAQKPRTIRSTEPSKSSQYTPESAKPSMTWAERLKATIASPSEKRSIATPTGLQDSGSGARNSANPTAKPGQQMEPREVSDRTELQEVPVSFPCAAGPVSPRRSLLPIEWQLASPSSSAATTSKLDKSLNSPQPSARSSEAPTRAYGTINKSQGTANTTDISMEKGSQTVTTSISNATSAPDDGTRTVKSTGPTNPPERLVAPTQHGMHMLSARSRFSLTPSPLSASSVPRTRAMGHSDPPKKPSYAEVAVASLNLTAASPTLNTPSSSSVAFVSALQTPESAIKDAKGALVGEITELNLGTAVATEPGLATPLKSQAGNEEDAAGMPPRLLQDQPLPEHQIPHIKCNTNGQFKRPKNKNGWSRKHKSVSFTTLRSIESLQRQPHPLTASGHHLVRNRMPRSEPNSAPLTRPLFKTSKIDRHGAPTRIGTEFSLPTGPLQGYPQLYQYTEVAKMPPCSKITIFVAAEQVGWLCPACVLKYTGYR